MKLQCVRFLREECNHLTIWLWLQIKHKFVIQISQKKYYKILGNFATEQK
jgi:hypothetical protein